MPLRILELPKQFRQATSVVYPPFKNGRYMEEFFYEYINTHKDTLESDLVYIPVFWTNLQIHPAFQQQKRNYEIILAAEMSKLPSKTKFFTIVQHDDGILVRMPTNDVLVFGACQGAVPLPLIYEDIARTLESAPRLPKPLYLASFVGTHTHNIRRNMCHALRNKSDIFLGIQDTWTTNVPQDLSALFIEKTLESKFCLAPRGNGRGSFRYFEAILLDTIPVYFWDDVEWLPYKEILDYSKFAVSIQEKDIPRTYEILTQISDEKYAEMLLELQRVKHWFTLESMSKYVTEYVDHHSRASNTNSV